MSDNLERVNFDGELAAMQARIAARLASPEGRARAEAEAIREAEEAEKARAYALDEPYRRLSLCGVPRRIVDHVRNPDQTEAVRRVSQWSEEAKRDSSQWALVLSSDKGCGKSVAAGVWMARTDARPIPFTEKMSGESKPLPSWWAVSRFSRIESYDGRFDALCDHSGPVVIDDIGSEYLDTRGWFLQALDAFVDARYAEYRPTLLTTNLGVADFRARYSARVVDRLREGGCFYEFGGASLRGPRAES